MVKDKKEKERRNHKKDIRAIFHNSGFTRVPGVGTKRSQFEYEGKRSQIDDLWVYENLIVIVEDTCLSSHISDHLFNKKIIYDLINQDHAKFIQFLENNFDTFKQYRDQRYTHSQCRLVIVYSSKYDIERVHKEQVPYVKFLDYPILQYFLSISKSIKKSSRFELFKFLGFDYFEIGNKILGGSQPVHEPFEGHILPEEHSCLNTDFKIVTFYMDAKSLLKRSYVLRKEGWQDGEELYQRMIINSKIKNMRKYLNEESRVYVNNIIVTLSEDNITLFDREKNNVEPIEIHTKQPVIIHIKEGYNIIGLVDGQHRVYSYHEGNDGYEDRISHLRTIQNLLVTGIIYPASLPENDRFKFEATLFKEINSNQKNAESELIDTIGLLLEPFSTIAIAKSILKKLNRNGPLNTLIKERFYEKNKIPSTTIVRSGLKPIVKLMGDDSLFKIWTHNEKDKMFKEKNDKLLNEYKDFCTSEINNLLIGYKKNLSKDMWTTDQKISKNLSVTAIIGLINCLRLLIENDKTGGMDYYESKLKDISSFPFSDWKSSQYRRLGTKIYDEFFN